LSHSTLVGFTISSSVLIRPENVSIVGSIVSSTSLRSGRASSGSFRSGTAVAAAATGGDVFTAGAGLL